jgi:anthranilate synthase component 2
MILLIDNYDSFSYNLYQLVGALAPEVKVARNDAMTTAEIARLAPSHIIISPGPGRPAAAGVSEAAVHAFLGKTPLLGVCLGHQAICEALGGVITYAKELMHGKKAAITLETDSPLFAGLPPVIYGARYHSLAAEETSLPKELRVTARAEDGEIMAVEHRAAPLYGLQFHPESIMTPTGGQIIENFLRMGGKTND